MHGVDNSYSRESNLWGKANYFAVNASYSGKSYFYTRPDGLKQMILFEVLTGYSKDYGTTINKDLKRPPEILPDPTDPFYVALEAAAPLAKHTYNSVSGETAGSRVYMMYTQGKERGLPGDEK